MRVAQVLFRQHAADFLHALLIAGALLLQMALQLAHRNIQLAGNMLNLKLVFLQAG